MNRKLASIQLISDIQPIEGADNIEVATVLGWQCVVKKGEFKANDICAFFEIDSILPEWPQFEFMRRYYYENNMVGVKGFRVKTIKLRKQISQGLAMPLSNFDNIIEPSFFGPNSIGHDLTETFQIKKYEAPENPEPGANLAGGRKGNWPSFLSKTDETRIQAFPGILEKYKGEPFFVTEKLDGTSFTAYLKDGQFGICSRNNEIKVDSDTVYANVTKVLDLETKLRSISTTLDIQNIAIQGEVIGPGIQKNKYKLNEHRLYVFNLISTDTLSLIDPEKAYHTILTAGLLHVPHIGTMELDHSIQNLVDMSEGFSTLYDTKREGLVFRPITPQYNQKLGGNLSFKVINPGFLLKHDE